MMNEKPFNKAVLIEYGIQTSCVDDLDDYQELECIISRLKDPAYLSLLAKRIASCDCEELVSENANALTWAVWHLSFEKLTMLSQRKDFISEHIRDVDATGSTPLHYLGRVSDADPRSVRLLVELGVDINAMDNYGWTALHEMADTRNESAAKELFKYRPKIYRNKNGYTPADFERIGSDFTMNTTFMDYEMFIQRQK